MCLSLNAKFVFHGKLVINYFLVQETLQVKKVWKLPVYLFLFFSVCVFWFVFFFFSLVADSCVHIGKKHR